jgi:hypothetical protein
MELAFRLLVAMFVIVAPSALFVGLWHGLHALRDDHLVARMEEHTREPNARTRRTPASLLAPVGADSPADRANAVPCGTCGTPNPDGVTFCQECLSRLS